MRRTTAISALVGALLLLGSPAVWVLSQPATSAGDLEVFEASSSAAADDPPPLAPPADTSPSYTVGELRGPLESVAPPARIAVPAIGVDAPIVPVALEPDGTMEIPEDVATIGWFEPGVRPGQPGSAVLSGHVDSRTQGRGAFFDLQDLDVGDEVTVDTAGGSQRWLVTARQRFAKDALPIAELFRREGDPQLVLITCGGEFDAGARSYSDNVVIVAVPA